jgi:thymidylate synthase
MSVVILVAYSNNRVIGLNSGLPWNIPDDLERFKLLTSRTDMKTIMLVGPKTYKTLPKSIRKCKTRHSMVIKRKDIQNKEILLSHLKRIYDIIYVIGGQWLYENLIDHVTSIMVTRIYADYKGDRYFPNIRKSEWKVIEKLPTEYYMESRSKIGYKYILYRRVHEEQQYLDIIKDTLENGNDKGNTLSKFGVQMRFLLTNKFPLLTTKKMYFKGIVEELLWFLRGETDVRILRKKGVHIWDKNTNKKNLKKLGLKEYKEYDAGPIYGFNFRHYGATYQGYEYKEHKGIDQLMNTIEMIKKERNLLLRDSSNYKPNRRMIINLWNPCQLNQVSLPACHMIYQFTLHKKEKDVYLSCSMYQRSGDLGLGVPFNIASASLLTIIISKITNTIPYELIHTIGDAHVYKEHMNELELQVTRHAFNFPTMELKGTWNEWKDKNLNNIKFEDFVLRNYEYHEKLDMKLLV